MVNIIENRDIGYMQLRKRIFMKYVNYKKDNFKQVIKGKKIICFGASQFMKKNYIKHSQFINEWSEQILFFVDSDEQKCGTKYQLGNKQYDICSISELDSIHDDSIVIMITTSLQHIMSICSYLDQLRHLSSCLCFSLVLLLNVNAEQIDDSAIDSLLCSNIPVLNSKLIHTFWFSGEEIPRSYQKCLDSWKRYCPDYEIKIWNSNNYDVTQNAYMYEAYQKKEWAFVSDYARLDVIYKYGGIYMDMDVEVLRKLDDLLKLSCFWGIEKGKYIDLGTGFGAVKGHVLVKQLMKEYDSLKFCLEDGTLNRMPQPKILLDTFLRWGYQRKRESQIVDGVTFLSTNYLNVYDGGLQNKYHCSGKEYLIHWYNAGWWSEEKREKRYKDLYAPLEQAEKIFKFCDL